MKIAVPLAKDNKIDEHFGHCQYYAIYIIEENNKITEEQIIEANQGCGCKSNIANTLSSIGVKLMLVSGIGEGAINALNRQGIEVIRGCSGDIIENINKYIEGNLKDEGEICDNHNHSNCSH